MPPKTARHPTRWRPKFQSQSPDLSASPKEMGSTRYILHAKMPWMHQIIYMKHMYNGYVYTRSLCTHLTSFFFIYIHTPKYIRHRTRNVCKFNYHIPCAKQNYLKHSFYYGSIAAWNKLPVDIKSTNQSLSSFKKRISDIYTHNTLSYVLPTSGV